MHAEISAGANDRGRSLAALLVVGVLSASPVFGAAATDAKRPAAAKVQHVPPGLLPPGARGALTTMSIDPESVDPDNAGAGFRRGAAACAQFWLQGGRGSPEAMLGGVLLALISAPICGVANALHAGVAAQEADKAIPVVMAHLERHAALRDAPLELIRNRVKDLGLGDLPILPSTAGADPAATGVPRHDHVFRIGGGFRADPVPGTNPTEVRLVYVGRGHLVRASDNTVMHEYEVSRRSEPRVVGKWIADDGIAMAEALNTVRTHVADELAANWLGKLLPCVYEAPVRADGKPAVTKVNGFNDADVLMHLVTRDAGTVSHLPVFLKAADVATVLDDVAAMPVDGVLKLPHGPTDAVVTTKPDAVDYACFVTSAGDAVELTKGGQCARPWATRRFSVLGDFRAEVLNSLDPARGKYGGTYVCGLERHSEGTAPLRTDITRFFDRIGGSGEAAREAPAPQKQAESAEGR